MNGPLKITLGILGAAVLIGGGLMTGHYWPKAQSRYRATTVFQIHQNSAPDIFPVGSGGGNTSGTYWFAVQVKTLTARNTLMLAVQNLNLETEWKLLPEEAAGKLERMTEVEQERGTEIVSLSAWSDSAEEAVTIANGVRDAYAQRRREFDVERVRRLTETIAAQIKQQEAAVEKSRLEILELMKKHNIVETSETPSDADAAALAGEAAALAAEQRDHPGYVTRRYRYGSQVQLLNSMREHAEKSMQEGVTRNPIEILETAVAVEDP